MPLPDTAFVIGDRFIGRVMSMRQVKIENRGADANSRQFVDGYEVMIERLYPASDTNLSLRFQASTSRQSKWAIWGSFWREAGIKLSNDVIGKTYLFRMREHVWNLPSGPVSTEMPAPVCEVSEEELAEAKRQQIDLAALDMEEAKFAGLLVAAANAENSGGPQPPAGTSGYSSGSETVDKLIAFVNKNGPFTYDKLVVEVLTSPTFASEDEIKAIVSSREKLQELGFEIRDSDNIVLAPPVPF